MDDDYLPRPSPHHNLCKDGLIIVSTITLIRLPLRMNMPIIAESPSTEKQREYSENTKQNL